MSKHWREPYSPEAAASLGIRTHEGHRILGDPHTEFIYYVRVCGFTFGFFSLEMLDTYLRYYEADVLPSGRRHDTPYSTGHAMSIGDGQSEFQRLPAELRKRGKRQKVIKALRRASAEFGCSNP